MVAPATRRLPRDSPVGCTNPRAIACCRFFTPLASCLRHFGGNAAPHVRRCSRSGAPVRPCARRGRRLRELVAFGKWQWRERVRGRGLALRGRHRLLFGAMRSAHQRMPGRCADQLHQVGGCVHDVGRLLFALLRRGELHRGDVHVRRPSVQHERAMLRRVVLRRNVPGAQSDVQDGRQRVRGERRVLLVALRGRDLLHRLVVLHSERRRVHAGA
jgi:hypothetical protein